MNKQHILIITILVLVLSIVTPVCVSASEQSGSYTITVVKYSLAEGQFRDDVPISGEMTVITGSDGERLYRMPGVTFRVIRVEIINGNYVPMVGTEAFYREETSDENGIAVFDHLSRGIYMVIVLEHADLEILDDPVIIHLPLRTSDGSYLYHVHIFPKSRLSYEYLYYYTPQEPGDDTGGQDSGDPNRRPPGQPGRLPQTAGSIGSLSFLLVGFIAVFLLGGFGLYTLKKKGL